jgi:hypothetical protein
VHEEDIMLVKGPTGAPERKPFDTRHECSEREWFVVSCSSSSSGNASYVCWSQHQSAHGIAWQSTLLFLHRFMVQHCCNTCYSTFCCPALLVTTPLLVATLQLGVMLFYSSDKITNAFDNICVCCAPQADDSGSQIKIVRGREASPSELATVLESQQEYNERRDGPHSTMQTVSQIIT